MVETSPTSDPTALFGGLDLPIYSNVLTFSGPPGLQALRHVYRPAPYLPLR